MIGLIKQKLFRLYSTGALHITMGTFLTKFVAFFGSIFVVRLMSKEDYGLLSYIENIYSYAMLFAGLGLSNALLRYLIVADEYKKKSYFNYIILNSFIRNVIILVVMIIGSIVINFPDKYQGAKIWIPVIAFLLPFQDLVNDDLFTLRAFFKNKLYAYFSFALSTSLVVGRILGVVVGGVGGVIWSRILINFLCGTIAYYFIKKRMFVSEIAAPLLITERRMVNSYSFQYMITNGFWALFMLNDTFLLGHLLNDPVALADYKVAYVLPGNISIIANAIGIFVAPYFTKNEKDELWVRRNYKKVFAANATVVGIVTLLIIVFGKYLVLIMYGEQYLNIVPLMQILCVAAFVNSGLRYTTANLLSAMGEVKANMYISFGGILLQTIADFLFIPKFGAISVAGVNCIVYFMMALSLNIVFYRKFLRRNRKEVIST